MNKTSMFAVALAITGTVGCGLNANRSAEVTPGNAGRCLSLTGTSLGFGTVSAAEHMTQGEELVPIEKKRMVKVLMPDAPEVSVLAPRDFCRVSAELRPVPGSLVKVQVWLPDDWNEKMHAGGGGGFNGALFSAAVGMRDLAALGYASVVTDVGHDMSMTAKFAHDNHEQFIDYGYRGNHATAVFTKDLIKTYYGTPAKRAYFVGGSNGGREALMQARRFPGDYDGIIAGAPATSFSKLMASFLWNYQAASSAPSLGSKLPMVTAAVLKKCDSMDGVIDEVIENPLQCPFDPVVLQCKTGNAPNCLNVDEVVALRKIYDGPRLSDGTQAFPGQPVGGEGIPNNWDAWIFNDNALQRDMGQEFFRWMVYGDPQWDKSRFDIDRDFPAAVERAGPIVDSDDPDISAFLRRGGKLIIHHGWADAAIPAGSTLNYYKTMRNKVGKAADKQVRLFMVPGMLHGSEGGNAPTHYDMLAELDRWVEGGPAPERVIASKYASAPAWGHIDPAAEVVRTRPLCAWPKVAHYNGSGSTDDAANFSCKE